MLLFLLIERKKTLMTLHSEKSLDSADWKILQELQEDARISYNELGRRVGLSGPAAAERVHKLEDAGILTSYGAQIDPTRIGLPLLAFIQLRCAQGKCLYEAGCADEFPEVLEMHKLSGHHCSLLKVAVSSMPHLEALNKRLCKYGDQVTNIVTSTVMPRRVISEENLDGDSIPPTNQRWHK
jgi:Lrp/AsnC family leucine-responsive transcriptional regulator